jgi:hypothetical protein
VQLVVCMWRHTPPIELAFVRTGQFGLNAEQESLSRSSCPSPEVRRRPAAYSDLKTAESE